VFPSIALVAFDEDVFRALAFALFVMARRASTFALLAQETALTAETLALFVVAQCTLHDS